jgi:hypothetical protein
MLELRLSIIKTHDDPTQDKRVDIHVTDADAVLGKIKNTQGHAFAPGAGELLDLANKTLANCGDTDKIEVGVDADGNPSPGSACHHKGDGSGAKVPFTL